MKRGIIRITIVGLILSAIQSFIYPAFAQVDSGAKIVSAVECINRGDHAKAEEILKAIIQEDDRCDAAWYYLGVNYVSKSDIEMVETCFQTAAKLDPDNFWYRYRLARLYSITSRQELSIGMYEELLKDFPDKSDIYFDLVELYASQGENEKALETISEIETVFGVTESLAVYRFNLLLRMNKEEEAYDSLKEYNSRYSSPYVLTALAEQHMTSYQDSLALSLYDEALDLAPDYAPAMLGKAEVKRMTMKYDEYFDLLNDYVSLPTEPVEAKSSYLSELIRRSDPKFLNRFSARLDGVLEKNLEVHPADSNALTLTGLYYYSTGRLDKAEEKFRQNADAHSSSLSANAGYVEFLMYAQRWEKLSEQGRESFKRFPKELAFLEMAIIGEHNLEHYDEVLDLCDRILESEHADSSNVVSAWSTKGDVYNILRDVKKASKSYEKALKLEPDKVYILNNYAYCLCENGTKLKKAYEMSRRTVEAEPDNATYLDTFGWILYCMGRPKEAKPHFKRAMLYGGKESPVILDHYAEVLFALGEYPMAKVYWEKALLINNGEIPDLEERVARRKLQMNKEK